MHFTLTLDLEVSRESGKFASRSDLLDTIIGQLEEAAADLDLSGLGADGESEYVVDDSSVAEVTKA